MTSCQKISFAASPLLAADRTTSGRHEPRIPQTARRNGLGFPRPRFGPRPKRPKNTKQTYSMALLMYCLYLLLSAYSPSRNSRAKVAYLSFGRKRKRERERERERERAGTWERSAWDLFHENTRILVLSTHSESFWGSLRSMMAALLDGICTHSPINREHTWKDHLHS